MQNFILYQLHDHEVFHFQNLQVILDENVFPNHMYKIETNIQDHIYINIKEI